MSPLKEVFKPKTAKNTGSKTPQFYNNEKKLLTEKGAVSSDPAVRSYFAASPHTPTSVLKVMLASEKEKHILRAVLMNDNLSRKSVAEFVNNSTDERVEWFADDQDLIDHFTTE